MHLLLVAAAWAWPLDSEWAPLTTGGVAMSDAPADASAPAVDLVSASSGGVAYWYADESGLYVRIRLDAPALDESAQVGAGSVGYAVDVDGDAATWEVLLAASGESLWLGRNTDADPGLAATVDSAVEWGPLTTFAVGTGAGSTSAGTPDAFLELVVAWPALGLRTTTSFRILPLTGAEPWPASLTDDVPGGAAIDDPTDRWSDALTIDGDEDGLTTPQELAHGTDPALADTDGGGLDDGDEDRDRDGVVGAWETDPLVALDDPDDDGDGIADALELRCTEGGPFEDRDGDGWEDAAEGFADPDGDGLPAFCDPDDDEDGVPTLVEGDDDTDSDGLVDALDSDADGDGVPDGTDGTDDADCDGAPAFQDRDETDGDCADPDADGLDNAAERACGSDPSARDSDRDGVDDAQESCAADADCDLLPDRIDSTDDPGFCTPTPEGADTACVDADPDDAWEDCPGVLVGGGGCACATPGGRDGGPWGGLGPLLATLAWITRRRDAAGLRTPV